MRLKPSARCLKGRNKSQQPHLPPVVSVVHFLRAELLQAFQFGFDNPPLELIDAVGILSAEPEDETLRVNPKEARQRRRRLADGGIALDVCVSMNSPRDQPAGSSVSGRPGLVASQRSRASERCKNVALPPSGPNLCQPAAGVSTTEISNPLPAARHTMNFVLPGHTPARLNFGLSERINFASRFNAAASLAQNWNSILLTSFTIRRWRRGIRSGLAVR